MKSKTVSVINTKTNKVTATIPVKSPGGVAVTPDGANVYA
jgi:YVTN family beta-propeller protein